MKKYFSPSSITKCIAFSAIMIALSFVLNRFLSISTTWFRLGFASTPIVLTSLLLGPFWGGVVGLSSDLISSFLVPQGAYFPGYTLDNTLIGILPYFVMKICKKNNFLKHIFYFACVFVTCLISSIFVSQYESFKDVYLPLYARVLIPIGFLVYYLILLLIYDFGIVKIDKFKPDKDNINTFSLGDIFIVGFVNNVIISLCLLPLWNYIVVEIPYIITSFSQAFFYLVICLIKPLVLYFIINPVIKSGVADKFFN